MCDTWESCLMMEGKNMLSAYSWNACITPGKNICMTTALSRIVTLAVGGFELCFLKKGYRTLHEIRLCPCVRFTIFGKVGDHGWFLCFMKSLRLPLQIWHAIYKWADKLQSCFRADTLSLPCSLFSLYPYLEPWYVLDETVADCFFIITNIGLDLSLNLSLMNSFYWQC